MKLYRIFFWVILSVTACKTHKGPDVSHIKINLQTERFEQDFFNLDTTQFSISMQKLYEKYPDFFQDFIFNILGLPAQNENPATLEAGVKSFIRSYKPVKDSASIVFKNFDPIAGEISNGLKHVRYYFPNYNLPKKLVTFIGPINSYGNIITSDAIAIGLQLYMGKNYSLYQSEAGQQLYPLYISKRFEPAYIAAGSIKNIISDMYPDNSAGKPLVEQMIEAGKRLYMLDQLMPQTPDTIKTGYTKSQLEGVFENEAYIWSFFLQNDLLFVNDPAITKDYMTDGPKTPVLGEASPGFIGQFIGWQIVKKWMDGHEKTGLPELMSTDAKKIFEEVKYKPK